MKFLSAVDKRKQNRLRLLGGFGVLAVTALGVTEDARAATLTTLFSANNFGTAGGAVYFNLQTGRLTRIVITGLTTNTFSSTNTPTAGFDVYTRLGTAQGAETSPTGWSLATTGTITPRGRNNPSPVVLNNAIVLEPNTLYGFALDMPTGIRHDYTTGTCSPAYTVAGNCSFSNSTDLRFIGGSANDIPFSSLAVQPRIWNGSITFDVVVVPEPSSLLGLLAIGTGLLVAKYKK